MVELRRRPDIRPKTVSAKIYWPRQGARICRRLADWLFARSDREDTFLTEFDSLVLKLTIAV